jgi:serine/threonine protein phosphatase PrpC
VFGRLLGCDTAVSATSQSRAYINTPLPVQTQDYFGIFDGHGGDATAHYVGEQLHHVLYEHIKKTVNAGSDDPTLVRRVCVEMRSCNLLLELCDGVGRCAGAA